MQIKLKDGDKVTLENGKGFCFLGEATIKNCSDKGCHSEGIYAADDTRKLICHCNLVAMKLISSANSMTQLITLTEEQKAGLNVEDQALFQLGLINADLTPSTQGFEYMKKYLFAQNRKTLADKAAKEIADLTVEAEAMKKASK